jgi:hypothetical protein
MSRSDSTKRKPNKENPVRNSARKHTRKSLPNPNPMKPSVGEHQPPPDLSNLGGNKNSKTLMAWGHKNSTNNSQGWEKTIPHHKKAREEAPLGEGGVTCSGNHAIKSIGVAIISTGLTTCC